MTYTRKLLAWREGFGLCVKLSVLLAVIPTICNAQAAAKLTAHRLGITQVDGKAGICSATAVGVRLLLTASHCFGDSGDPKTMLVDGKPAGILAIERDGADHALVRVSITFRYVAKVGNTPPQGANVYFYGNPGLNDIFRRGYVAGKYPDGGYVLDCNVYFGDSGAGMFGATGELVGVVSGFVTNGDFKLGYAKPLAFTAEQWARVR